MNAPSLRTALTPPWRSIITVVLIASLCSCARYIVLDRLDTLVLVGFGEPVTFLPDCIKAGNEYRQTLNKSDNCGDLSWIVNPQEEAPVWVWAANSRDFNIPHAGKTISFEIVDRDGIVVPESHATIQPHSVRTGLSGRNMESIQVVGARSGVYRIRALYQDRGARSFAYSPYLIVQTHQHATKE